MYLLKTFAIFYCALNPSTHMSDNPNKHLYVSANMTISPHELEVLSLFDRVGTQCNQRSYLEKELKRVAFPDRKKQIEQSLQDINADIETHAKELSLQGQCKCFPNVPANVIKDCALLQFNRPHGNGKLKKKARKVRAHSK
jgi:hypothetical protein